MDTNQFQRIQKDLLEKRENLLEWVETAPPEEKALRTGEPSAQPVQAHLQVIDHALQEINDGTLGVCDVCHMKVDTNLLEVDYNACVCLDHYTESERRQLEAELEFSQTIQRALMPQQTPSPAGIDFYAYSRPAQIVSGDYFDFLKFADGTDGFAIADAVGHGVSAGLLMSSLQTALRLLVPDNTDPGKVLERVNRLFLYNHNFTTFVTIFLARYDLATHTLTYASAGHNPPLLVRKAQGSAEHLLPTGPAVGLIDIYPPCSNSLTMNSGDLLVLYTDGVTEARDSNRGDFGLERLETLALQNSTEPAFTVVQNIRLALEDFLSGQPGQDDTTVVAARWL
jgi:sigma-B regulation protein RsbU (phosphoserine phosphatase)